MKKVLCILFLSGIVSISFGQTDPKPQPPLDDYVGKYVFPDGSVVPDVEVVLSSGALSMISAAGTSALTQLGVDSFSIVEFSGTAVFKRGDDKKVNSVHIEAMGYILDGTKVPTGNWEFTVRIIQRTKIETAAIHLEG